MAALATQMRHFGLVNALAQERVNGSKDTNGAKQSANDAAVDYKALVCIFLNGGNDGSNTIIPNYGAGYGQYSAVRQAQGLAIAQNTLLPVTPPSLGQDYGFHPSLFDLHQLWGQGKVAVVCNVGTLVQPLTRVMYQTGAPRPLQLFSHSDQVEQFSTSISNRDSTTGWGGRLADNTAVLNPGAAVPMITSIAGATVFSNGSSSPLIVTPAPTPLNQVITLDGFSTAADDLARRTAFIRNNQTDLSATLVQAASSLTQQAVNVSEQLSTDPTLSVEFPATNLGNQLKQVAKLMKFRTQFNMGRQIFYVQLNGFDTHSGQLANQTFLLFQVAQAMRAFYEETVAQGISSQVTTFTMSDFGRTLNPSGSGGNVGTDHGWGNHLFVMGGAVQGGNFYGRPTANGSIYPTLLINGPDDADTRGRFIPTVSVEMYAATLARWFGLADGDIQNVFPGIINFPTSNLGFML